MMDIVKYLNYITGTTLFFQLDCLWNVIAMQQDDTYRIVLVSLDEQLSLVYTMFHSI